jgi:hypothetical protein
MSVTPKPFLDAVDQVLSSERQSPDVLTDDVCDHEIRLESAVKQISVSEAMKVSGSHWKRQMRRGRKVKNEVQIGIDLKKESVPSERTHRRERPRNGDERGRRATQKTE